MAYFKLSRQVLSCFGLSQQSIDSILTRSDSALSCSPARAPLITILSAICREHSVVVRRFLISNTCKHHKATKQGPFPTKYVVSTMGRNMPMCHYRAICPSLSLLDFTAISERRPFFREAIADVEQMTGQYLPRSMRDQLLQLRGPRSKRTFLPREITYSRQE